MRGVFFLLILFCYIGNGLISAQSVSCVMRFNKNTGLDSLLSVRRLEFERYADRSALDLRLHAFLSELRYNGYLEASVDSVNVKLDTAWVSLHLGKRYLWGEIKFMGWSPRDEAVTSFRIKNMTKKEFFDYSHLLKKQDKLLTHLENCGYPFACIMPHDIDLQGNRVNGSWSGVLNPFFVWDSVVVKGTLVVNRRFLQRYLGVIVGDPYSEEQLQNLSGRVNRLGFVREIKPAEVEFRRGKARLYTYLDKQSANQFSGVLGLLSNRERGRRLEFSGDLKLNLVNSFLHGESFSLHWQKMKSQSQRLISHLEFPYLLNSNLGLDVGVRLLKQDSSYVNMHADLGVQFLAHGGSYVKLYVKIKSSSLIETAMFESTSVLPDYAASRSILYGVGLKFSNLDYRFNPRRGWSIETHIASGKHRISKSSQIPSEIYKGVEFSSLIIDGAWELNCYLPLGTHWVFKFKNQGAFVHNETLFENDLYRLGGFSSLRGFDEESIYASAFGIFSGEMRFLPEQNSAFFVFWDGCAYIKNVTDKKERGTPWGVGLGMNFQTGAGIFSLSYALGKNNDEPIEFRAAKIHFGVMSRF